MTTARTWVRCTPANVSSFEAWENYVRAIQIEAFRAGEASMRERAAVFASAAAESDMLGDQIRALPLSDEVPKPCR